MDGSGKGREAWKDKGRFLFIPFLLLSLSLSPSLSLFSVREGNGERKLVDLPFDNAHASQKFTMKSSRSLKPSTVSYSLSL
jgi:hypothetical protein